MLHELLQYAESVTQDYDQYVFSKGTWCGVLLLLY